MTTIAKLVVGLQLDDRQFKKSISSVPGIVKSVQAKAAQSVNAAAGNAVSSLSSKIRAGAANLGKGLSDGLYRAVSSISPRLASLGSSIASTLGSGIAKAVPAITGALATLGTVAAGVMGGLAAGAGIAAAGFAAITAGAHSLAMQAAPLQGVKNSFAAFTQGIQGGSQVVLASLQQASSGMITNIELMRQFNLASQLVSSDFAQRLPEALQYLGKVSMATGQDMGFMLNSLTVGVGRMSPLILDNLGIQVNLTQAYADYAKELGVSTDALTKAQQQTALMNQVMGKLQENTAALPPVFGSAAQVFGAFKTELQNIKDDVGMDLLPTFTSLYQSFQKLLPAVRAFAQGFAGAFAGVVEVGKSFVKGLLQSMGVDFNSLADNAGSWGENIVVQLASGMARAIGAVISVLNQLGQAIASWLAPGSPPKLLPELPAWGKNAADWFLKGMTQANVGILRELSGTVDSFIRSMMKDSDSSDIAKTILSVRQNIEKALSGGGGGSLLDAVPKQLRGMASAMIQAEKASQKLAKAQANLNKVQDEYNKKLQPISAELQKIKDRQEEVAQQIRGKELDAMEARARAEGDTLALELIAMERRQNELEKQKSTVEAERDAAIGAAEDKVSAAEKEQQAAQDRLELERQLIQHQIETNNLLAETVKKLNETGGAAGSAGGAGGVGGLTESLKNLGGISGPISGLSNSISGIAQAVLDQFEPLKTAAEGLGTTWGGVFTGITAKVQGFITFMSGAVTTWKGNIENIRAIWQMGKENIEELWDGLKLTIEAFGDYITGTTVPSWQGNIDQMKTIWDLGKTNIVDLWDGLQLTIQSFIDWFAPNVIDVWSNNIGQLKTIWSLAKDNISQKWDSMKTDIQNAFAPIQTVMDNFATGIGNVVSAIQSLITWVGNLAIAVANFDLGALTALLAQSPPPLAVGIGMVGDSMDYFTRSNLGRLKRGISTLPTWPGYLSDTPQMSVPGMGAVTADANHRLALSGGMGGTDRPLIGKIAETVIIKDNMDMAIFEARVKKTVVSAMRNKQ